MKDLWWIAILVTVVGLEMGLNTLTKAALNKGMNNFIFCFYSNVLGLVVLLCSSLIYYRRRARPPLTFFILFKIFVLALFACAGQTLIIAGIKYSSPTLASAMTDLTPAFTFIIAIISRMESLDLRVQSSLAKNIGTLVSISGALVVTLYKGLPIINSPSSPKTLRMLLSAQSNWILGAVLLAAASLSLALIFIVQTWVLEDYPEELMVTAISCSFMTIMSAIVSVIAEHDLKAWNFSGQLELIAIAYSAIFVITIRTVVYAWACRMKGPLYVAMFTPVGIVIAVILGVIFLGDTLYLGCLIGAAILAVGFYGVVWGKSQEERKLRMVAEFVDTYKRPLLQ